MADLFKELDDVVDQHHILVEKLFAPDVTTDARVALNKERARLEPLVEAYEELKTLRSQLEASRPLLVDKDPEIREMARDEVAAIEPKINALEEKLKVLEKLTKQVTARTASMSLVAAMPIGRWTS